MTNKSRQILIAAREREAHAREQVLTDEAMRAFGPGLLAYERNARRKKTSDRSDRIALPPYVKIRTPGA